MASLVRLACAVVSASTVHGTNMVRAIGCAPRRYLHWSQVFLNKDRGGHSHDSDQKLVLPEEEWRNRLTPEQYYVCRQKGTEPPFSGKFNHNPKTGIYTCACCGAPLFSSKTKYDSGSGWPSFYDVLREGDNPDSNVVTKEDRSHGMVRVEVLCKKCDCHLGHVFDDGPAPTRQRYCINSASLDFIPNKPNS